MLTIEGIVMNIGGLGSSQRISGIANEDHRVGGSQQLNTAKLESSEMPTKLDQLMGEFEKEVGKFNELGSQLNELEQKVNEKLGDVSDKRVATETKAEVQTETKSEASAETKKSKMFSLAWFKEKLQSAKEFFTNLVEKLAIGKSAKETGEAAGKLVETHTENKQESIDKELKEALKNATVPQDSGVITKTFQLNFGKFFGAKPDTVGQENLLTNFKQAIDDRYKSIQENPNGDEQNLAQLSKKDFTTHCLKNLIQYQTAIEFSAVDPKELENYSAQSSSNQDLKDLASELSSLVELARTPLGSIELFGGLAKEAMRENTEKTFLRATTDPGAAAVRKIMLANGANDFAANVSIAVNKAMKDKISYTTEEGKDKTFSIAGFNSNLIKLQSESTSTATSVKNLKDGGITADIVLKTAAVANKLLDITGNVPIPSSMKTILVELQNEIGKNSKYPSDDPNIGKMKHNLFSDQVFLKVVGPSLFKDSNKDLALKHGQDFVGTAANGVQDQGKYPNTVRETYAKVSKNYFQQIDSILNKFGMKVD